RDFRSPVFKSSEEVGSADAKRDAEQAAGGTERHSLNEKLQENVAPASADRHADADFASALGDADEHDVHNADAADEQRYAGDAGEQPGHRVRGGILSFEKFLRVAEHEIVIAARLDGMALAQQFG